MKMGSDQADENLQQIIFRLMALLCATSNEYALFPSKPSDANVKAPKFLHSPVIHPQSQSFNHSYMCSPNNDWVFPPPEVRPLPNIPSQAIIPPRQPSFHRLHPFHYSHYHQTHIFSRSRGTGVFLPRYKN